MLSIALNISSSKYGLTNMPVSLSWTASSIPVSIEPIAGTPNKLASRIAIPKPSASEILIVKSAALYKLANSSAVLPRSNLFWNPFIKIDWDKTSNIVFISLLSFCRRETLTPIIISAPRFLAISEGKLLDTPPSISKKLLSLTG